MSPIRIDSLDDSRLARSRAEALASRGRGDALIREDLEGSGVSSEAIEEALGTLEPEADRARQIAAAKGQSAGTARYLARNGFSEDAIETAVGSIAGGEAAGV